MHVTFLKVVYKVSDKTKEEIYTMQKAGLHSDVVPYHAPGDFIKFIQKYDDLQGTPLVKRRASFPHVHRNS